MQGQPIVLTDIFIIGVLVRVLGPTNVPAVTDPHWGNGYPEAVTFPPHPLTHLSATHGHVWACCIAERVYAGQIGRIGWGLLVSLGLDERLTQIVIGSIP